MPMSEEAAAGLRSAIECNPDGGVLLLSALREMPAAVKYKDVDPYGPIHGVLNASVRSLSVPEEMLPLYRVFGDEWSQRAFSKGELADAVEQILGDLGIT